MAHIDPICEQNPKYSRWVHYTRAFIMSGCINPPENQFKDAMEQLRRDILNCCLQKCDQLEENFRRTQGPNAPGIKHCQKARAIIVAAMK